MSYDRQSATELGPLVSRCDHLFGAHSGILDCLAALRECPDMGMPLKGGDILLRACEALLREKANEATKLMEAYFSPAPRGRRRSSRRRTAAATVRERLSSRSCVRA